MISRTLRIVHAWGYHINVHVCVGLSRNEHCKEDSKYLLDGKKRSKRLNTDLIMLFLMLVPILIEPAQISAKKMVMKAYLHGNDI